MSTLEAVRSARSLPVAAPVKLSHVVFRTNRLAEMKAWYQEVIQAKVVHSSDQIAFLSYDDEHHRVALIATESYAEKPAAMSVGFYHAAFTFASVGQLFGNYARLKPKGILPYRCINHGPTLSFYYNDPDGNNIELQVDAFPDLESCTAFMQGPLFAANPIGIPVDPDDLVRRYLAGESEAELLKRADR